MTSSQALANPYSRYISLDRDFVNLPNLAGIIGDRHLVTRDRMGRDLAFLCRVYMNGWSAKPRGIAVDEATALLIDGTGNATVVGASPAYFLQAPGGPQVCVDKIPLTYLGVAVYRIQGNSWFNLATWSGQGGVAYTVSANG